MKLFVISSYSPTTSRPERYVRFTKAFASATFVNFSAAASHASVCFGKRVATLPSRTASVSGPA